MNDAEERRLVSCWWSFSSLVQGAYYWRCTPLINPFCG